MTIAVLERDVKHLRRAVSAARTSTYRWKHGCVIAKGNRVIEVQPNKYRNSPLIAPTGVTVHAERAAIRGASSRGVKLAGTTIYIARVGKSNNPLMSRPCPSCMKEIIKAGVRKIVFTNEAGLMSIERVERER